MVHEGSMLGHQISAKSIEVDKEKIQVIANLPPPISVKGTRNFFGHAKFYRRFIKDLSKIIKPLCNLLVNYVSFVFSKECILAFNTIKKEVNSSASNNCTRLEFTSWTNMWCNWPCTGEKY